MAFALGASIVIVSLDEPAPVVTQDDIVAAFRAGYLYRDTSAHASPFGAAHMGQRYARQNFPHLLPDSVPRSH